MDKTVSSRFSADLRLAERVHRQDRQGDLRIGSHSARCPRHIERIERETRIKMRDQTIETEVAHGGCQKGCVSRFL